MSAAPPPRVSLAPALTPPYDPPPAFFVYTGALDHAWLASCPDYATLLDSAHSRRFWNNLSRPVSVDCTLTDVAPS